MNIVFKDEPYVTDIPKDWECLSWSPDILAEKLGDFELQGRIANNIEGKLTPDVFCSLLSSL